MKPNFALSLSFEGIKLLHRAAGGWREVGEVPVNVDDLASELAVLRRTASSLEPGGVRTKLLIPSSQIKYLTIDTMGLSDAARRKAAETALHDATPYEVSELAYDISIDGMKTHVAAVARETLAEAEAFATEHRFHPVSFVAVPGDAAYLGEPFFGTTQGAAELLEPEEVVEPDGIAVVVVGAINTAATVSEVSTLEPVLTPEPTPEPELKSMPEPEAKSEQTPKPDPEVDANPGSAPDSAPESAPDSASAKIGNKQKSDVIEPAAKPAIPETAQASGPAPQVEQEAAKDASVEPPIDAAADEAPAVTKDGAEPVIKAPEHVDQKPATPEAATPEPAEPELELAPTTKPEIFESDPNPQEALSKEQSAAEPKAEAASTPVDPARAALMVAAAATGASKQAPPPRAFKAATPIPDAIPPTSDAPTTGFASRRNTPPVAAKPVGGAHRVTVRTPRPDSSSLTQPSVADTAPSATIPVAAAARSIGGFLSRRKPRKGAAAPVPAPATAIPVTNSETERMTVFGARAAQVGGKPRFLGLIMTVILLVFLAGVAAWAAVFLDDGLAGLIKKDSNRAIASAPENQIDPEIIRTPEGIENAEPAVAEGVQIAALDPVLSAEEAVTIEAPQNLRQEPQVPVITEAEAAARYAVTGIWPLAPTTLLSDADTVDLPVYRSGIDPISGANDALALPAPQGFDTDVQLAAVMSPPPFGQSTVLDENGLIVPTSSGIVAPGGYTLFLASPPRKPPVTLARFAARPAVEAPTPRSPLADERPKNRPLGLSESSERAQLGGVSRIELAAFRPSLRPRSLQDRAKEAEDAAKAAAEKEEARAKAAAQSATAAAAAALLVPQQQAAAPTPASPLINATRLATAQSTRPDTRPRNFSRIVKRAQRAAPQKETRVAAAASVAPRTVKPSLPSKASVARSATVKNAINLRKVNLIGVYGKPSSRRALVRLGNGRYKKVRVGDRIDGGRVSAISNSELRYSKGGRNVVLKMP